MGRSAACGFRTTVNLVPAPDWTVFGALPTEFSLSMRKDGTPGVDDNNGVQIPGSPAIGHQVKWVLTDDGQIDPTSAIFQMTFPAYYESLASPLSTDSWNISGIISFADFGGLTWGATGPGIVFTPRNIVVDPNTGLAFTRADIFSRTFGYYIASQSGTPNAGATVKFWQGIPRVNYTPTALVANVTSLPDGTAGQSITIKGDNFNGLSANCRVRIGPLLQDATNIVVVNVTTITCDIPDLTAYNGTNVTVFVSFNAVAVPSEENIWTQNSLILTDPDGLSLGGTPPPPPPPELEITGSGGLETGGSPTLVLTADVSGMYTLVPGQKFDRVYSRNTDPAQTTDVAIPTPFGKTAFLGN